MPQFDKHFTLAEARALLPRLRQIFQDAHRRRQSAAKADEELAALTKTDGVDLGGPRLNGMIWDLMQVETQIRQLHELGIQIKDFERGLVDFPHLRDGQEVFLCWELEEDDIEFWHDIDAGYADRERL